jgi:hypothetical protein
MDIKNKRILEALQMQPLSEEEMTARHILGRLYGPIATCVESTRNGRLYNRPLWEKALEDEIFLEKVATKALFLELGHPADREETDMKQACACIPEVPKIVGDDLCAYVDILDTPNGRLLKTLVDYGFVPGISSRGSGDVMDNNQVDPETFFLETWDIVQLPAVKKARLNICESLDSENSKLRKALVESYKAAKDEDKDTMKKALENFNIDIEKEATEEEAVEETDIKSLKLEDIPWAPDEPGQEEEEVLMEEMPAEEESEEETEEVAEEEVEATEETEEVEETTDETEESEDTTEEETLEDETPSEEQIVDVNAEEEVELDTVGDAIEMLQEYDDDMRIEFDSVQVDGKEYPVETIGSFIDDEGEEDILVLGVNCGNAGEPSDDTDEDIEAAEESEDSVETIEEVDDTNDNSADDDGDVEVIESLKDLVRQKEALETEVSDLRKAKTVGDAKEQELQEKLNRYRTAFKNTSAEAAKVPELQAKVQELTEKLTQSKTTIKRLTEKVNNTQQLKESIEGSKATERRLNEEMSKLTEESKNLKAKLEGQTKVYTEKLQERTNLAKAYKARFIETLNKYVDSKASMLGVKPSEITSRLNENYTLADVDAVCDQILDTTVNFSRLPFSGRAATSARIAESVSRPVRRDPEYGYEIDDDLLELAGLKK